MMGLIDSPDRDRQSELLAYSNHSTGNLITCRMKGTGRNLSSKQNRLAPVAFIKKNCLHYIYKKYYFILSAGIAISALICLKFFSFFHLVA